jgi:hypothetical protein
MGLGQTLLTILALAMMGTLMLTVNTNTMDSGQAIEQSEYRIMATSLGISMLERANGLAFDQNTVSSDISSTTSLTATLGKETGETESTFNDFDDYNSFSKWVLGNAVTFRSADYRLWSSVEYVTLTGDSVTTSAARTYHKRIRIWVASPFMQDTLQFQSVYSYWYFR